ncbi:MAG: glycosyltransferase family 2 protein [Methanobacteriota archaeon]|nr:MAG: glycosyltransferase family 2 protein [Euryarchaeota archaeon]
MATEFLWVFLTILAILGLIPNGMSLGQGLRLRGHVRRAMRLAFGAFLPPAVVILPVRGMDPGFDDNVRAIVRQTYPKYRLVVVADDPVDSAADQVRAIARETSRVPVSVVVADPGDLPGKVNAVRSGLLHLTPTDEVVVFADSDIRPAEDWLRQLVQPLADSTVGVATGFRWYVPPRPTFWSLVRTEWNAVSANVLFDPRRAFAWGGSCAVRRDHLRVLRLEDRWREVLSDDLVLSQAVRDAGLKIAYAPAALVPTFEGATRAICLEWCVRQMMMATLYLPIVRRYAAASFAIFDGSVILGLASLSLASALGPSYLVPAILFLAPLLVAVVKAFVRRRALFSAAPSVATAWKVPPWRVAFAALAVPWVMAWGLVRTRRPTSVRWRGHVYDVRDPQRIRLLDPRRGPNPDSKDPSG